MKRMLIIAMITGTLMAKQAELVDIRTIDPSIQVNLVFATGHTPIIDIPVIMYEQNTPAYICKEVASALARVQAEMKTYGYCLQIRDAYRPIWAQQLLWHEVLKLNLPNPGDYISDPVVEGGRHTRGTAVDLTLLDSASMQEISLPPFCFDERAHRDYYGSLLTTEQIKNRDFLRTVMLKHGFSTIRSEWWHFDWGQWQEYEPLNLSFDELK